MTKVEIFLSGDDSKYKQMLDRAISDQEKLVAKMKAASEGSKKLSDEEIAALKKKTEEEKAYQKLVDKSVKVKESLTTAEQKYAAAVAEADQMKQKQLLTDAQHAQRLQQLQQELRDATGETKKLRDAQAAEEQAVAKADAVTRRYLTTLEKLQADVTEAKQLYDQKKVSAETLRRAEEKLAEAQKKVADASRAASEATKDSYQPTLIEQANAGIEKYTAGVSLAGMAVTAVGAAWRQVIKEQEQGLASLKSTEDSDRNLLQIAQSSQDFRQMTAQADQLSMQTGVDRSITRDVIFQGASEGFRDAVPDIIAASQVITPRDAANVAGQVPALFEGQVKAMEAVSMTLKASQLSRLNFDTLGNALPVAAEGANISKATPAETLASLSVLASSFNGNGSTAADRIRAFTTRVGIDQGAVDEDYEQKLKTERERAANAAKQLRAKEERVADLEAKIASGRLSRDSISTTQTQLERAKRDVAEFDRSKLEVVEPKRSKPTRESLRGKGIVAAVEAINAMTEDQRAEFLKTDQEMNAAYMILKKELPKIKEQMALIEADRKAVAQGGGSLKEQVAIANADPIKQAQRAEAIAQRKKEVTLAEVKGVEGANAATAKALAESKQLRNESVITRTIASNVDMGILGGVGLNDAAASAGSLVGLSPETSADLSTRASRGLASTGALGALVELFNAMRSKPEPQVSEAAQKQAEAAAQMKEAAESMKSAARQSESAARQMMRQAIPNVDAIRAQIRQGAYLP